MASTNALSNAGRTDSTTKTLTGNAALPGVDHACSCADLRRTRDVSILEHDVAVRASQLEHRFLQHRARHRRDRLAGTDAPGQCDCGDARILDQRLHLLRADQDGAKKIPREACLAKN